MTLWMFIVAGAVTWTIGDILMKYWLINNKTVLFVLGIMVWTVGLLFLAHSFRFRHMAVASTMMITLNSILLIAITWFYFKEQLSPTELLGIAFSLVGLALLEF